MTIQELKQKLFNVMMTKDTKLMARALRLWSKNTNVNKVEWADLAKNNVYGYYVDNENDFARLSYYLKWFDHRLDIIFRGYGGHYLLICLDGERIYEVGPKDVWHDNEEMLLKAYGLYEELFNSIFDTFKIYCADKDKDDNVDIVKVALTKKEKAFLKTFAEKQHPEAKDNCGTVFPTIHVVRDVEYLSAEEGDEDGTDYAIINDWERTTYHEYEDFKEAITDYLEEFILDHYVSDTNVTYKEINEIFETIKTDCYHGFDNIGEELQELLKENCGDDIEEKLNAYKDVYDELLYNEYSTDFDDLNEKLEELLEDDCYKAEIFYYHEVRKPIAFFLIREEAKKYIEYQGHNLHNPDIYTYAIGYGNKGDLEPLANVLLKLGQEIIASEEKEE